MSVADKCGDEERAMPVKELPMPPVQVQRPDTTGGAVLTGAAPRPAAAPVPQINNLLRI